MGLCPRGVTCQCGLRVGFADCVCVSVFGVASASDRTYFTTKASRAFARSSSGSGCLVHEFITRRTRGRASHQSSVWLSLRGALAHFLGKAKVYSWHWLSGGATHLKRPVTPRHAASLSHAPIIMAHTCGVGCATRQGASAPPRRTAGWTRHRGRRYWSTRRPSRGRA